MKQGNGGLRGKLTGMAALTDHINSQKTATARNAIAFNKT